MLPTRYGTAVGAGFGAEDVARDRRAACSEPLKGSRAPAPRAPHDTEISRLWRKRARLQETIDRAPRELTEEAFASLVETLLAVDRRIARAEACTVEDLACKVMIAAAALETDGDCAGAFMRLAAPRSLLVDAERILRRR